MPHLGTLPRRLPTVLLLSVALALTGCGDSGPGEDRDAGPAQRAVEEELEELAAVADARVTREAFDTDYWGEEIVVDMAADATAAEVAEVLDAFRRRARETNGDPQDARVTLGAGTTERQGDDFAADAAPGIFSTYDNARANDRMARLLVTAAAALPDQNVVIVSPEEWSVFGSTETADPRRHLSALVDAIRAEDLLATSAQVSISVRAGGTEGRFASLSAPDGLTPDLLDHWRAVADAFETDVVRTVWFAGADVMIGTRLPADVRPKRLTTEAYGDLLWPMVREQLEVLADIGEPASLWVSNEYAFDDDGYLEDRFVNVRLGRPARHDRHGRAWNAAAVTYLDQVRATR